MTVFLGISGCLVTCSEDHTGLELKLRFTWFFLKSSGISCVCQQILYMLVIIVHMHHRRIGPTVCYAFLTLYLVPSSTIKQFLWKLVDVVIVSGSWVQNTEITSMWRQQIAPIFQIITERVMEPRDIKNSEPKLVGITNFDSLLLIWLLLKRAHERTSNTPRRPQVLSST